MNLKDFISHYRKHLVIFSGIFVATGLIASAFYFSNGTLFQGNLPNARVGKVVEVPPGKLPAPQDNQRPAVEPNPANDLRVAPENPVIIQNEAGIKNVDALPNPFTTKGTDKKITFQYSYNNGAVLDLGSSGLVNAQIYKAADYENGAPKANALPVMSWFSVKAQKGINENILWDGRPSNALRPVADGDYVFEVSFKGQPQSEEKIVQGVKTTIDTTPVYSGWKLFEIASPVAVQDPSQDENPPQQNDDQSPVEDEPAQDDGVQPPSDNALEQLKVVCTSMLLPQKKNSVVWTASVTNPDPGAVKYTWISSDDEFDTTVHVGNVTVTYVSTGIKEASVVALSSGNYLDSKKTPCTPIEILEDEAPKPNEDSDVVLWTPPDDASDDDGVPDSDVSDDMPEDSNILPNYVPSLSPIAPAAENGLRQTLPPDQICDGFQDVSIRDPRCPAWKFMRSIGIKGRNGFADPGGFLQRDEIARILKLLFFRDLNGKCISVYRDVGDENFACGDIADLTNRKVITGYLGENDFGTYRPERAVNRAEFAALLARNLVASGMATLPVDVSAGHNFDDVEPSQWYSRYVGLFFKLKIWPGKYFYADQYVRRVDFVDAVYALHLINKLP